MTPRTEPGVERVSPLFAGLGQAIAAELADYDESELAVLLRFITSTGDAVVEATRALREGDEG